METKKNSIALTELNDAIATNILPLAKPGTIFLLSGQLGAGKTTLVKALIKQLGITSEVSSPTFGYVNSYKHDTKNLIVHHFDLYRLNSLDEFLMQGFDEFLHQDNALVIAEWPELLHSFLQQKKSSRDQVFCLTLEHNFTKPNIRYLSIAPIESFPKIK
jgi:tRNA threonylcarbamoyladenosine biosynthesis protein TsaE